MVIIFVDEINVMLQQIVIIIMIYVYYIVSEIFWINSLVVFIFCKNDLICAFQYACSVVIEAECIHAAVVIFNVYASEVSVLDSYEEIDDTAF